MRVGNLGRQVQHVGLINLYVIHPVAEAQIDALVQDDGGIVRHPRVVAVGGVSVTGVEHLPGDIRPAIPEQLEGRARPRRRRL